MAGILLEAPTRAGKPALPLNLAIHITYVCSKTDFCIVFDFFGNWIVIYQNYEYRARTWADQRRLDLKGIEFTNVST